MLTFIVNSVNYSQAGNCGLSYCSKLVRAERIELSTPWLKARCSTTELRPHINKRYNLEIIHNKNKYVKLLRTLFFFECFTVLAAARFG